MLRLLLLTTTALLAASAAWAFQSQPPLNTFVGLRHASTTSSASSSSRLLAFAASDASAPVSSNKKTVVVAGATGYIGKQVVQQAVRDGRAVVALVRNAQKAEELCGEYLNGATVIECDVCEPEQVDIVMEQVSRAGGQIDAIISCLASRSGIKKDAYKIDYQATLNCVEAGRKVKARQFVLLSAFCVKNPWLQFQQAKLKLEAALQAQSDMVWSIVRPTAFFKSVSGQLEVCQSGAPFVMFGDGKITRCNPIAESDLAAYMLECTTDATKQNKVLNVGGPDEPLTMQKQGEMLFSALGKEPNFFYAPVWLFDTIIDSLQWLADTTGIEALENAAETGRIGKYYAVEEMLTTDPSEKYGTTTLQEHYNRIAVEGQEYDPYTTMFAEKSLLVKLLPKEPSEKEEEVTA